jgi:hypothetical protein
MVIFRKAYFQPLIGFIFGLQSLPWDLLIIALDGLPRTTKVGKLLRYYGKWNFILRGQIDVSERRECPNCFVMFKKSGNRQCIVTANAVNLWLPVSRHLQNIVLHQIYISGELH